jgi:hypothetical protein
VWDSDDDGGIILKTRPELEELHIARLKTIFQLDPKKNLLVPTRFCTINIAGFDLDIKNVSILYSHFINLPLGGFDWICRDKWV